MCVREEWRRRVLRGEEVVCVRRSGGVGVRRRVLREEE